MLASQRVRGVGAVALVTMMLVLAACGGDDDSESNTLSDEQNQAVDGAVDTINDQCAGYGAAGTGADEISEAIDVLIETYQEAPDAVYEAPGRTDTEPLQDVLQDSQDTLRTTCPIGLLNPSEVDDITEAIVEHSTSDDE